MADVADAAALARRMWAALGGEAGLAERLAFTGDGALPSAFAVTDFAAASVAVTGLAAAELAAVGGGRMPMVTADRRLASLWFGFSLRPRGWAPPPPWDPVAGDYQAGDGRWIRLHTNAPHHRAAALAVLQAPAEREAVARAVAGWQADALETRIVAAGGCAAAMLTPAEWAQHPQGRAVAAEPLAAMTLRPAPAKSGWAPDPARPLAGLRVLDLTRVLAGPVATRALAGFGAEVLRIDPPDWDEPGVVPEVTLGKRCARLDLADAAGRAAFARLLAETDILVHGYRPGALDGLGLGAAWRQQVAPALIEVTLDAYGWTGPWAGRRGFDSLVQMSAGIAAAGSLWAGREAPKPLPVQALDQATGYLMAAAALRGMTLRQQGQGALTARLSLARTAAALPAALSREDATLAPATDADEAPDVERTSWGEARRLRPPLIVDGMPMRWDLPATELGSSPPEWTER